MAGGADGSGIERVALYGLRRKEKTKVNVAALNGPTGIGMVQLMDNMDQSKADEDYSFTLAGAPDELTGKITSGEVDIAALPTNLAATLYQKTQGKVTLIALNTLGTMYVVEKGNTVNGMPGPEWKDHRQRRPGQRRRSIRWIICLSRTMCRQRWNINPSMQRWPLRF